MFLVNCCSLSITIRLQLGVGTQDNMYDFSKLCLLKVVLLTFVNASGKLPVIYIGYSHPSINIIMPYGIVNLK